MRSIFILIGIMCGTSLSFAQKNTDAITQHASVAAHQYRSANEKVILRDFIKLLSMPNDAAVRADILKNADHIQKLLAMRGLQTELLEAGGAPAIYGERVSPGAQKTILIYAHYDGQPVNEKDWATPPWQPTLRDSADLAKSKILDIEKVKGKFDPEWRLYARSAGDDKAPVIALIVALDALKENNIPLSVNLKILFDGEEEKGSPTLAGILDKYRQKLDTDLLLFCDGPVHQTRRMSLAFGARGTYGVHITTYGPIRPLHSGHYGNWAPNSAMMLVHLLSSMRDDEGKILIENYYEKVIPPSQQELLAVAAMPDLSAELKHELGLGRSEGNHKRLEELIMWPAINLQGLSAGGVGGKAVNAIVTSSTAAVGLRLVPAMTLKDVREKIAKHIEKQGYFVVLDDPAPEILRSHAKVVRLDWRDGGYPSHRTNMQDPRVEPLIKIMRGVAPDVVLHPTHGGSLPLYLFAEAIKDTPIVILPLANHDNNQHAENENIRLQNLWDGIAAYSAVLASYGNM